MTSNEKSSDFEGENKPIESENTFISQPSLNPASFQAQTFDHSRHIEIHGQFQAMPNETLMIEFYGENVNKKENVYLGTHITHTDSDGVATVNLVLESLFETHTLTVTLFSVERGLFLRSPEFSQPVTIQFLASGWHFLSTAVTIGRDQIVQEQTFISEMSVPPSLLENSIVREQVREMKIGDYLKSKEQFPQQPAVGCDLGPDWCVFICPTCETGKFSLYLLTQPVHNVVIQLKSSAPEIGEVHNPHLFFTPQDWNISQEVQVKIYSRTKATEFFILTDTRLSADPGYQRLNIPDIKIVLAKS